MNHHFWASQLTLPAAASDFTPKSELIDALGRTVRTTEHLAHFNGTTYEDVVMRYAYDIKGQLLVVTDPLDRVCFEHKYDTAGNNLWTNHLDSGAKTLAVDAQGKPLYSTDAKEAEVYTAYDTLHRPVNIWAKDGSGENVTLRQHMLYGDSAGLTDPQDENLKGKLYQHYDEAGKATITGYDFKGNPLEKTRQVIADTEFTNTTKYVVDWTGLTLALETKEYVTSLFYDGLNRMRKSIYPEDVDSARKELVPTYNNAGALEKVALDGTEYLRHVAYNAKGQRVLAAMGNDMMTRYAYDAINYRLQRIKTEKYAVTDSTYTPQSGTTKQDSGYEYDLGGNILKIKERITECGYAGGPLGSDALDRVFAYDPLKRLLQATGRESTNSTTTHDYQDRPVSANANSATARLYTQSYEYDKVGNILKLAHQASGNGYTRHYHYENGVSRLVQLDNGDPVPTVYATFTHDSAGNEVQQNTERFLQWDAADQLRYFKIDTGGGPSKDAHYLYAGGQRIKKFVRDENGNAQVTIYIDGVYEHSYKRAAGGGAVAQEQNLLHVMDGRSKIATIRLGDAWSDPSPPVCYNLEDHLGTSTTRLTDQGGPVDREEYYPFGESSLRTMGYKRYRYVGKERDEESGLYYYGARYYAAWVCRFISVDPLMAKYPQLTPYNYAANDPVGDFDIDGKQNNNTEQAPTGKDPMDFNDLLPKGNDTDSTKPAVVQRMERDAEVRGTIKDQEQPLPLDGSRIPIHINDPGSSGVKGKDEIRDLTIDVGIESGSESAGQKAETIRETNKISGRRIDTNGDVRQAARKYSNATERGLAGEDQYINSGNQYYKTVRGVEGYNTPDARSWTKIAGHLQTLGAAFDGFSILQAAKGDISPFALAPYGLGALTVIVDESVDENRAYMMEKAIGLGYESTKGLLEGFPHAYENFQLVNIDQAAFEDILKNGGTLEWNNLPSFSPSPQHAALIMRATDRERGPYTVVRIWVNQFKH